MTSWIILSLIYPVSLPGTILLRDKEAMPRIIALIVMALGAVIGWGLAESAEIVILLGHELHLDQTVAVVSYILGLVGMARVVWAAYKTYKRGNTSELMRIGGNAIGYALIASGATLAAVINWLWF